MEIPFRGQYDKSLFFRSVMLANQPPRSRRFVRTFMFVFIVAAVAVLVSRLIETGDFMGNVTYIVLVMIIGAFLVRSYLQPYLAARSMWANPSVRRKLEGVVTKDGIIYRLDTGTNEILWERFHRVRKINNLITLVTREGLLVIFPHTFFKSDAEWLKFERLVNTKIVPIN